LPVNGALNVLDDGAQRGSFALKLAGLRHDAAIVAIEPDTSLTRDWSSHPQIDYLPARLDNIVQSADQFDLIYSCRTIGHLKSPRAAMERHWRALKPGGLLFLEAANLAFIAEPDIVEEVFADGALYHFSAATLAALAIAMGFSVVEGPDLSDAQNVWLLLRKDGAPTGAVPANPDEVALTARRILDYRDMRGANLSALAEVAAAMTRDPERKVAVWGAGQLLQCLIDHGRLDPARLAAVVDKSLLTQTRSVHGVTLTAPENLGAIDPDLVVVLARGRAADIEAEARRHAPRAHVASYANLLAHAKRA
jgi:hypothetical protein